MDKSKAHGRKHGRRDRKSRRKEEKKAVITDERFAEVHTNPVSNLPGQSHFNDSVTNRWFDWNYLVAFQEAVSEQE